MLDYTNTVNIEDKYARFFSIFDMEESHVRVLALILQGMPVPLELKPAAAGLKSAVDNLARNAVAPFPIPVTDIPAAVPPATPPSATTTDQ